MHENTLGRVPMSRSFSLVLAASVLSLSLPHYSLLPVFYLDKFSFDMVSEVNTESNKKTEFRPIYLNIK